MIRYIIFQYDLEPVLIQRIFVSFEAILERLLFVYVKKGKSLVSFKRKGKLSIPGIQG